MAASRARADATNRALGLGLNLGLQKLGEIVVSFEDFFPIPRGNDVLDQSGIRANDGPELAHGLEQLRVLFQNAEMMFGENHRSP